MTDHRKVSPVPVPPMPVPPMPVYVPIPEAMIVWPQDFGGEAGWDVLTPRQRRLHLAAVGGAVATLAAIVAVAGMGGIA